jgi:cholesterol oxidase
MCEVRRIEPLPSGGYRIGYVRHDPDGPPGAAPSAEVTADRLVIGAGTFGSTYLLLRNRAALPALGRALGTRFSGNGDLLTFLRRSRRDVAGVEVPRPLDPEYGPVITSAIRLPDTLDGHGSVGRGFYVEDGGNPQFLDWIVQTADMPSASGRVVEFALRRLWSHLVGRPRSNISGDVSRLLGGGVASSTLLPMLTMGRDVPDGVMRLRDGDLDLDRRTQSSASYYDRVEATLGEIARVLGAKLANTPLWLFKRAITVHPLGGVPMGDGPDRGVVDQWGEVFSYPGLHVVDGSVMPGPVGPNPSLTIAAFAERAAAHIVGQGAS